MPDMGLASFNGVAFLTRKERLAGKAYQARLEQIAGPKTGDARPPPEPGQHNRARRRPYRTGPETRATFDGPGPDTSLHYVEGLMSIIGHGIGLWLEEEVPTKVSMNADPARGTRAHN